MPTDDVWPALQALAATWTNSPVVQTFLAHHPARNNRADPVTEALRNIQAGSFMLTEAPLWTTHWEPIARQLPLVEVDREVRNYLREIAPIGRAVESTVSWVRSRLPLYPAIPTPQFSPRGYRRSPEISHRLPWMQPLLQANLQSEPAPPGVECALALHTDSVADGAQDVLAALIGSGEWQCYTDLAQALTQQDRTDLDDARHRVGAALNPRLVNDYEPDRGERRNQYRRARTAEAVAGLSGRPMEFANAFEAVDDLIDDALVSIHGQLVIRGEIPVVSPTNIELDGLNARFELEDDGPLNVGESIRLDDPLVPGIYRIDDISFSFNSIEGGISRFSARRLPGADSSSGLA
ncbi:hypothetical protein [Gordonia malaquae]|uniref:hypothetical protein n=1 Tax=Gordonia malaquae TaxID=410332 RepID=UPI0030EFA547